MTVVDVLLVTRQFAMRWGGAEHSIAEVLDELTKAHPKVKVTVTDGGFDPPGRLRRLPLVALARDRGLLRAVGGGAAPRLVLAQSMVAPTVINALPERVPVAYFLRDVAYWNQWPNNEDGARRWAKAAYRLALAPFTGLFQRENRKAMIRADLLVANSVFMADRIRDASARDSLVVFPRTPVAGTPLEPGSMVGLAGDGADKGGSIVRALARRYPDVRFRIHTRAASLDDVPPNVEAAPWEREPAKLYQNLRLMLVPSQVAEAYGRVALEAQGFGVPALVSHIGGLPENVPGSLWRVADYRSPEAWIAAFEPAYRTAPEAREAAHGFAQRRRIEADRQHRELILRLAVLMEHGREGN